MADLLKNEVFLAVLAYGLMGAGVVMVMTNTYPQIGLGLALGGLAVRIVTWARKARKRRMETRQQS